MNPDYEAAAEKLMRKLDDEREAHAATKAELLGFQKQSIEQQELVDHLKAELEQVRKTRRDLITELERVRAQRDGLKDVAKTVRTWCCADGCEECAFIAGALAACEKENGDE